MPTTIVRYTRESMFKRKFKFQIGLALAILISILLYFWGKQIPQETIEPFVRSAGPWAPISWILLHQVSYVIAPISGLPFLVVGFYLFGKTVIPYSYFVVLIGATINFWISRIWGRSLVKRFAGQDAIEKIDKLSKEYGVITLIAARLLQGGIGDFVSYAYGLTPIKFSTYVIITALAIIPGNVLWYYAVSKTNSIEGSLTVSLLLAFFAIAIFFIGNFLVRRFKKKSR